MELNEVILSMFERNHGVFINLDEYSKSNLTDIVPQSSFGEFLVQDRIKPILKMFLIQTLFEEEFYLAYESSELTDNYSDQVPAKPTGPLLMDKKLSGIEIFEDILFGLAIGQIIAKPISPFFKKYDPRGEFTFDASQHSLNFGNKIFISPGKFYINDTHVYLHESFTLPKREELEVILKNFVQINEQKVAVDHESYIVMLLQLFPGKIHIRSIA